MVTSTPSSSADIGKKNRFDVYIYISLCLRSPNGYGCAWVMNQSLGKLA